MKGQQLQLSIQSTAKCENIPLPLNRTALCSFFLLFLPSIVCHFKEKNSNHQIATRDNYLYKFQKTKKTLTLFCCSQ